jgi:hypothetical protein
MKPFDSEQVARIKQLAFFAVREMAKKSSKLKSEGKLDIIHKSEVDTFLDFEMKDEIQVFLSENDDLPW